MENDSKTAILDLEIDWNRPQSACDDPGLCPKGHARVFYTVKKGKYAGRKMRVCRTCSTENSRKWVEANPDRVAAYKQTAAYANSRERKRAYDKERLLRKSYGISVAERDALFAAQGGECPICQVAMSQETSLVPSSKGSRLTKYVIAKSRNYPVVDHCHTTGKVRGILCLGCNRGLGFFRDDPAKLRRAADYLDGKR